MMQDILFQQDNSLVYQAFNLIEWLKKNYIEVEGHPLYSSDLNRIEHVWKQGKNLQNISYFYLI